MCGGLLSSARASFIANNILLNPPIPLGESYSSYRGGMWSFNEVPKCCKDFKNEHEEDNISLFLKGWN